MTTLEDLTIQKEILENRISILERQILGSNEEWRTLTQALKLLCKYIKKIDNDGNGRVS